MKRKTQPVHVVLHLFQSKRLPIKTNLKMVKLLLDFLILLPLTVLPDLFIPCWMQNRLLPSVSLELLQIPLFG